MPTLKQSLACPATTRSFPAGLTPGLGMVALWLAAMALMATGCKKDAALQAMDSDANGYLCLKCGVKLYTARAVFIGPQCPKCQQETLMDVVGYECAKDHHLTIRPKRGDSQPLACEVTW